MRFKKENKKLNAFYSSCCSFNHGKGKPKKKHWQITYLRTGKKILKHFEDMYAALF